MKTLRDPREPRVQRGPALVRRLMIFPLVMFAAATAAAAEGQEKLNREVTFNIPAQPLDVALLEFSKQADMQLMLAASSLHGQQTQGIQGKATASTALAALLKETGLIYETIGGTVTVKPAPASPEKKEEQRPLVLARAPMEGPQAAESSGQNPTSELHDPANASRDASAEKFDGRLEEIVVTARKQEESLQRVPVSIVAVSGEDIEARSIQSLSDLAQSTPNFNWGQDARVGRNNGVVYMRGVGPSIGDPTVGIYVDGVYIGDTRGNDLETMDLERVEVLRGPQGTLFGRNTSGGAVNIVTRRPDASDGALSGRFQVTGGSRRRFDVLGSLNIPLVADELALQIGASRRKQDGYGRRIDGQDLANTDRFSGRVALQWTPTDRFTALFSVDGMTADETTIPERLVAFNLASPSIVNFNAVVPLPYDERWLPSDDFFSSGTGPNATKTDVWGAALTLDYEFGWATLTSISAYRASETVNDQDVDNSPASYLNAFYRGENSQFSEELRLSGKSFSDRLNWTLGLYYFHGEKDAGGAVQVWGDQFQATIGNPYGFAFANVERAVKESSAAFGQANYNLTDALRATVGARVTRDTAKIRVLNLSLPNFLTTRPDTVYPHMAWTDVSPRFGLDYQFTPDFMLYASAAKGYKSGGPNGNLPPYRPEESWTYELGWRSDLLDRRLRFNATGFYNDYTDLQLSIGGSRPDPVTGVPTPFGVSANIPKVHIVGAEVELSIIPVTGLTLSGNLGLINVDFKELPNDPRWLNTNLVTGDSKMPYSPEVSYTLAAEYAQRLGADATLTTRVDYAHKSEIFYNLENTSLLRQSPYGLLNARLTFEHVRSGWSLSVFGTNLTDEHYFVGGFDQVEVPNASFGFAFQNMAAPREFGVSAQWRF